MNCHRLGGAAWLLLLWFATSSLRGGEAARYFGLVTHPSQAIPNDSGSIEIRVTPEGGFSGKARTGPSRFRFKGRLDGNGEGEAAFKLRLKIETPYGDTTVSEVVGRIGLRLDPDTGLLAGQIDYRNFRGGRILEFLARPAWTTAPPPPGSYNFLLEPPSPLAGSVGPGFGTLNLGQAGKTKVKGRLRDGKVLAVGTQLCEGGYIPVYERLRHPQGAVLGWLHLASDPDEPLTGMLEWTITGPPDNPPDPEGSLRLLTVWGAPYHAPDQGSAALAIDPGVFLLENASTGLAWMGLAMLDDRNRVQWLEGDLVSLPAKVQSKTGWVTGQFVRPDTGAKARLHGIVLQQPPGAAGFFLSSEGPGRWQWSLLDDSP